MQKAKAKNHENEKKKFCDRAVFDCVSLGHNHNTNALDHSAINTVFLA